MTVGEKAVVADTHESRGENVEKETPNEFHGAQRHDAFSVALGVILPAEADFSALERLDTLVGDSDSVRVAGEIFEHLGGTAERRLGVDDPLFVSQGLEQALPRLGMGELEELPVEFELLLLESALQQSEEFTAEHSAHDANG